MRTILVAALLIVAGTGSAFAQFPPPGLYACATDTDIAFGELLLQPDGDYQFTPPDGETVEGQMTSSGTDVRAETGVLFDQFHLVGSFATSDLGDTSFAFTSDVGPITCGLPVG